MLKQKERDALRSIFRKRIAAIKKGALNYDKYSDSGQLRDDIIKVLGTRFDAKDMSNELNEELNEVDEIFDECAIERELDPEEFV